MIFPFKANLLCNTQMGGGVEKGQLNQHQGFPNSLTCKQHLPIANYNQFSNNNCS